ncbi:MAG TPA: hypothetical protein VHF90_08400, partial [Thermoleophilaceae bacterium]|nr:hypothetical protein [Thermoleophilaceae bacterium]
MDFEHLPGAPPGEQRVEFVPISFPIPLAAAINGGNAHPVPVDGPAPAGCTGGSVVSPKADPGHICVYAGLLNNASFSTFFSSISRPSDLSPGTDTSGALVV